MPTTFLFEFELYYYLIDFDTKETMECPKFYTLSVFTMCL